MSMLAIYRMPCCGREMVFGRFKGNSLHLLVLDCMACHTPKVGAIFGRYEDDNELGIFESGKWNALQVLLPAKQKRIA
jgi:hypothetical protein